VTVEPADYLVVEGCGSSVGPARDYVAVSVFVDADPVVRMRRGLERDGDAYRPHWQRWAIQEAAVFATDDTMARADLVIDTSGPGIPSGGWNQPT
jgi:uridine kinase